MKGIFEGASYVVKDVFEQCSLLKNLLQDIGR